jgi:hypothetical protein
MKPLIAASCLAVLALPLAVSAQEQKPATTTKTLSAQEAPKAQDSPLVRAAKASGRLGKKPGFVITNEMLAREGGHITTTTIDNPLPEVPKKAGYDEALVRDENRKRHEAQLKAKADAAKAAAEKRQQAIRRAAGDLSGDTIEEGIDDPAMQEHQMEQLTNTTPKTETAKPTEKAKPPSN